MEQTLTQLEVNAMTQRVYPKLVYPGYDVVNRKREQMGSWHATGEGAKSFRARLVSAGEDGNITLVFTFNDYMRFVDMGVGQGTKAEDVDSARKARYQTRYVKMWDRKSGKSQRPAIMMELRHLQRRIRDYLVDYYGKEWEGMLLQTFDDLPEIQLL